MGVSCKCTTSPRARVHPLGGEESHFYWAEEGAAFNLKGFRGYFIE